MIVTNPKGSFSTIKKQTSTDKHRFLATFWIENCPKYLPTGNESIITINYHLASFCESTPHPLYPETAHPAPEQCSYRWLGTEGILTNVVKTTVQLRTMDKVITEFVIQLFPRKARNERRRYSLSPSCCFSSNLQCIIMLTK